LLAYVELFLAIKFLIKIIDDIFIAFYLFIIVQLNSIVKIALSVSIVNLLWIVGNDKLLASIQITLFALTITVQK
jgi:hypothetical protein